MNNGNSNHFNYLEELWFLGAQKGEGASDGIRFVWQSLFPKGITEDVIKLVLREVPEVFPKNWNPQEYLSVTSKQRSAIEKINSCLSKPIDYLTVKEVITKAQEYERVSRHPYIVKEEYVKKEEYV